MIQIAILILGAWAASSNWLWSKGFIALWCSLFLLSRYKRYAELNGLIPILSFLTLSSSLCALGLFLFPVIHPLGIVVIWFGILGYALYLWQRKSTESPAGWPSPLYACGFVLVLGGLAIPLFHLLGHFLHQPHVSTWGTSLTWAAVGFLTAYPRSIAYNDMETRREFWIWLTPLLTGFVLIVHGYWYFAIRSQLDTNEMAQLSSQIATEKALRHGYTGLAIQGILDQTVRLFEEQGWADAVRYHRGMWHHTGKDRLARAFLNHPALQKNLFLFTSCYGCSLQLNEEEYAIDFAVLPERSSYWILTSQGRLLCIGLQGIESIQTTANPAAMAIAERTQTLAILDAKGTIEIWQDKKKTAAIVLSHERVWKDLLIEDDGAAFWTLDGNGRIERYSFDPASLSWQWPVEVHPPLWGESDIAQAFFPGGEDNSFFVLDKANGIHWRANNPLPQGSPLEKRLLGYYNPNRQVAADLGYWEPLSSLLMLEQTGRVLFIPVPSFSPTGMAAGEIAAVTGSIPMPIDSVLQFDPSQSTWFRKLGSIAVAPLPEADTILVLQRDGVLQAIAMPPRFHIRFVHPNRFRLGTGSS